ncbi:MAG: CAP domain-containing protein [Oscillospiraceae bacterium]|jgi:uncharacterized protein YkwD|nr:CAP domain-containing protein [Oscillospiraceae bacterium]
MMKKSGLIYFIAGVFLGALIFGGATAIAAGITATATTSRVLVNGVEVSAEAYSIHDNNFFKLRDIAAAVGFSVVWDGAGDRVLIDTSREYDANEQYVPPTATPTPTATPEVEIDVYEYAAEVVRYTNIEREKVGLPPLIQSAALTEAAMRKSQDMVENDYVGHTSPVFGKTESIVRLDEWKYMGENVTNSGYSPETLVKTFMLSKGHKENILRQGTTHIGVGVAITANGGFRWTQLFGANISE